MTKRMLIDGLHAEEIRVVIADNKNLLEFDIETAAKKQTKSNIFLAKVTRVEPSLQAAFVEYGSERQGFLPFSEIHPDYYQIPLADRQELLREEEEAMEAELAAEEKADEKAEKAEKAAGKTSETFDAGNVEEVEADDIDEKPKRGRKRPMRKRGGKAKKSEAEKIDAEDGAELVGEIVEPVEITEDNSEVVEEKNDLDGEMEELGDDDPHEIQPKRKKSRRYKIQEVIKKNQIILIQVIKEERGNKGASVTSYISLPGRYCVLMPNSTKAGGVSRKINDSTERKRLKDVLGGLEMPKGMSLIMRTNGIGRTKPDITRDYNYLIRLWNLIRENTLKAVAPALVYEEGNVITRSLRDLYQADFEDVVVSGEESYKIARDFMKMIMPSHVKKVVKHEGKVPIFQEYGIEAQLTNMYDPIVPLPSGGYIVINSTEALISVDVNSGRSTGERNVEDMATSTNIQAADEVARQLRLRDLAGLVVIDFIDMLSSRHRRQVENALKSALKSDRAKIQVGRISPFGLLEMSRQRLRSSLTEMNMIECPTCKGVGIIRSNESAMVQIIRTIEGELAQNAGKVTKVILTTSPDLALHFLNHKRKAIAELEAISEFELVVETEHMPPAVFKIQLEWADGNRSRIFASDDREGRLPQSLEGGKPKRRRGGKKSKGRDRENSRDDNRGDNHGDSRGERGNNNERSEQNNNNERKNNDDAKIVEPAITEDTNKFNAKAESKAEPKEVKAETDAPDFSAKKNEKKPVRGRGNGKKPIASEKSEPKTDLKIVESAKPEVKKPEVKIEVKIEPKAEKPAKDLPPANVIIDESTTQKKKATKGGWWKKIVE